MRGSCVVANRNFHVGEFVMPYEGDFISAAERWRREKEDYLEGPDPGSYIVDTDWQETGVAIDATPTRYEGTWGRLVNHATDPNLRYKLLQVNPGEDPRMVFSCRIPIKAGEELFWDYTFNKRKDPPPPWAESRRKDLR